MLLVRLHLADFYWGDVSLSNVLFRRNAGGFAAYLVDAETGELRDRLSPRLREHDLTVASENVFAELLDLQASDDPGPARSTPTTSWSCWPALPRRCGPSSPTTRSSPATELWRIERRIERLNDLGFDVDELDIVTDFDGDQVRIQPKVVELGHHRRELQSLTGLDVEERQARRLLNDLASFTAALDLGREDRALVANRWLTEVYEPLMALVPAEARGKLEPAEVFHEVLVHRWYLSERAGHEVDLFEAAADFIAQPCCWAARTRRSPPTLPSPSLAGSVRRAPGRSSTARPRRRRRR